MRRAGMATDLKEHNPPSKGARMRAIEGVYVANVTPFRDDASLSVDVDSYLAHVSWLKEVGVRGVVPFGTNGEGPSVTLREKLRVLDALFERNLSIQIIPTVMQGNLPETLEMVGALDGYPATAVLVLPPYYFKPASAQGLKRFFEPVLGATSHPVIVYHVPKYADRKSTRLNSSHANISYAVFCLKKKKNV